MADPTTSNALSGGMLSRYMVKSLPKDASSQLKTAVDAIALAVHAAMLAVGFRLVGLGEDHRIEASSDGDGPSPLPAEWNAHSGSYAFRYKHHQSSMEYLLKVNKMGNKATIMGMGMGDDRVSSFDLRPDDYVSDGNLPLRLDEASTPAANEKTLQDVFISAGRLSDLGSLMRLRLIQKLAPGLQKDGYEPVSASSSSDPNEARQPAPGRQDDRPTHDPLREPRDPPARPYPLHDPLAQPPARPRGTLPDPMPGFDDEYDLQRPLRGARVPRLGAYGERDLYPQGLGPNDPLRGGIGPGLGGMGGGGMHPTFDDPMFGGQGRPGGGGGGGFNPQAPPGARWDPTGPGFGGPRGGGGLGGRPPNPFGGFGSDDFI